MSKRVVIIHCWSGSPDYAWYPWLKKELENQGHEVIVPEMPDTDEPRINKWVTAVKAVAGDVDENTYFVGHSMGVQTVVRYLQGTPEGTRIGGAVFVAGFFKHLTNMGNDPVDLDVMKEWLETPVDLESVSYKLKKSVAIFSESDPFVPLDNQDDFKDKLGSEIVVLPGPGHFSGSDECVELPDVFNSISKML